MDKNWRDKATVLIVDGANHEVPCNGVVDLYAHVAGKYPKLVFMEVEEGYFHVLDCSCTSCLLVKVMSNE